MIAVLDNIRSVYNVGSIFRTADGAGIEKLYLCGITPTPLNKIGNPRKKMEKVALGAEKSVEWEKKDSTVECLKKIKEKGFTIYAVEESSNSVLYDSIDTSSINKEKLVLVFGNEVEGLNDKIIDIADKVIEIPMRGIKNSLNVSISFGIIAYYFSSQKEE